MPARVERRFSRGRLALWLITPLLVSSVVMLLLVTLFNRESAGHAARELEIRAQRIHDLAGFALAGADSIGSLRARLDRLVESTAVDAYELADLGAAGTPVIAASEPARLGAARTPPSAELPADRPIRVDRTVFASRLVVDDGAGGARELLLRTRLATGTFSELLDAHDRQLLAIIAGLVALYTVVAWVLLRWLVVRPIEAISALVTGAEMPEIRTPGQMAGLLHDIRDAFDALANERRFTQDVLTALGAIAYRYDLVNDRYAYMTGGLDELVGLSANDVIGRNRSSDAEGIVHPADLEKLAAAPRRFAAGEIDFVRWRIRAVGGGWRTVLERGLPVRDASGRVVAVEGIVLDVTADEAVRSRVELLEHALESIGHEIVIISIPDGRLRYANETFRRSVPSTFDASEPGALATLLPDAELARVQRDVATLLTGESDSILRRYFRHDAHGAEVPRDSTLSIVRRGGEQYLIIVGLDVSDRLEREQALAESQSRLELALQGSAEAVWQVDLLQDQAYLTEGFAERLGIAPVTDAASFGQGLRRTVHPDDVGIVDEILASLPAAGYEIDDEFRVRMKWGSFRWVVMRGRQELSADGAVGRVAGVIEDVTNRKVSEYLLRDTAMRLTAVLENVIDAVISCDGSGNIRSINAAAERILGIDPNEAPKLRLDQFLPQLDSVMPGGVQALANARRTIECEVLRGMLDPFPAELSASRTEVSDQVMYLVVLRDISERRRAESELVASKDRAEEAARVKANFLATMSHEIRTPLNGVLGMTQLLLDTDLRDDQLEVAQVIQSSGESLLAIVNDVLDFSKVDAGGLMLLREPFDLHAMLLDVLEMLALRAGDKGLQLWLDYPMDLPVGAEGDATRTRQIALNLIGNAIKFTDSGYVRVVVRAEPAGAIGAPGAVVATAGQIGAAEADNRRAVTISIEDTGIGIDADKLEHIFNPFAQADEGTARRHGGTGLGLAICREIVGLMNGTLAAASRPGEGSTFSIRMPLLTGAAGDTSPGLQELAGRPLRVISDDPRFVTHFESLLAGVAAPPDRSGPDRNGIALIDSRSQIDTLQRASLVGWRVLMLLPPGRGQQVVQPFGDGTLLLRQPLSQRTLLARLAEATAVPAPRVSASAPVAPAGERPMRVLLAEDNLVNQKVAKAILEKLGCEVVVAIHGAQAVERFQAESFDMVLMDCQMPVMDGLEATRTIRQLEADAAGLGSAAGHIPIVALTAHAMPEDRENCLNAGMDDYLSKPVRRDSLRQALIKWIPADEEARRTVLH